MGSNQANEEEPGNSDGIRVVRELRMESDSVVPVLPHGTQNGEFEMGERSPEASENKSWDTAIEWDLGNFEFPDYQERMNCPI